ncbi:MAG TPA: hypothetical protein VE987_14340 [Polyangiaceae bacterium]|nr:hypothetical protein [Polyangiaceae bacterium]
MTSLLLFLSVPPLVVALLLDWVRQAGRPPRGAHGGKASRRLQADLHGSVPTDDVAPYVGARTDHLPPSQKRPPSMPSVADH